MSGERQSDAETANPLLQTVCRGARDGNPVNAQNSSEVSESQSLASE